MSRVLIIGGGASGLLVAVNLLRTSKVNSLTIAEPADRLGRGVAYGTTDPDHLLNVPAGRMSGLVDRPSSLCDWAKVEEGEFVPRRIYGEYLEYLLSEAIAENSGKTNFTHLRVEVSNLINQDGGYKATFSDGTHQDFDAIVLAIGNSESLIPKFLNYLPESGRVVRDMWREPISKDFDDVALIGTGLSFYDAALTILRDRPSARISAISRTGLLPSPHLRHRAPALPVPDLARTSAQGIRDYLVGAGEQWREAQDGIRHDLQEIWASFPDSEKQRFLDQNFRWWNSLRHRSAPDLDESIKREIGSGRITLIAGEITGIAQKQEKFRIDFSDGKSVEVDQIINCCGNRLEATQPLIKNLLNANFLSRGPIGLGVGCDPKSLLLKDGSGRTHERVYGIGPILVGELFETTAIPEIRIEAATIAGSINERFQN